MRKLIPILLAPAALLSACASPTIDAWAVRGLEGVANARQNVRAFADLQAAALADRQAADIDAVFRDIARLAGGGNSLSCTSSRPADPNASNPESGSTRALDDIKQGLLVLLAAGRSDEKRLQEDVQKSVDNLDQTAECFTQIQRLRNSWGTQDQIDARLAHLTGLVNTLLQERRKSP